MYEKVLYFVFYTDTLFVIIIICPTLLFDSFQDNDIIPRVHYYVRNTCIMYMCLCV